MSERLPVRKTYKLFIGGAFVRSESGRYDRIEGGPGADFNIPRGSRKDVRDAVAAARKALPGWAGRTAYNRGQILYRFAEALESRAADIGAERSDVEASIDVLVHYAGWTDKLQPVLGGINPVAAPFLSSRCPSRQAWSESWRPTSRRCSAWWRSWRRALAAGNSVVAVLSDEAPLPGLDLGEVMGIADVPAGVVNLLSGRRAELAPVLASHHALNAIVDAAGDTELAADIDKLAAESVTRVRHIAASTDYAGATADPLSRLEALTELKTAWHPVGA